MDRLDTSRGNDSGWISVCTATFIVLLLIFHQHKHPIAANNSVNSTPIKMPNDIQLTEAVSIPPFAFQDRFAGPFLTILATY